MIVDIPLGPPAPPRLRISVGFRRVVFGEDPFDFRFLGSTSLADLESGREQVASKAVVARRRVLVAGVRMPESNTGKVSGRPRTRRRYDTDH